MFNDSRYTPWLAPPLMTRFFRKYETSYIYQIVDYVTAGNIFVALLFSFCIARLISEYWSYPRKIGSNGLLSVPSCPSWIPYLGHIISLVSQDEKFLIDSKARMSRGVFALNLLGTRHNMIYSPSMIQTLLSQRDSVVNFPTSLTWWFLNRIGGLPNHLCAAYESIIEPLSNAVTNNLMREPGFSKSLNMVTRNFEEALPKLVSLNTDKSDGGFKPWEQIAGAKSVVLSGKEKIEVDLRQLITNFVAYQALPSIFGTDLFRNNPNIYKDLWDFNSGFLLLGLGLPSWLPIPILTKARRGRVAVTYAIGELHHALNLEALGQDPGPSWTHLDDVSNVIIERNKIYRAHNIEPNHNADLSILWALMANSNFLVFWLLLRIWSNPDLMERIRNETECCVHVTSDHNTQRPKLKINDKLLATSCPLLKASYIECLRLDSAPHSIKKIQQGLVLTESRPAASKSTSTHPNRYSLCAGEWANIPFFLHFKDPDYFAAPEEFRPERYFDAAPTPENPDRVSVSWRTVRPYGGGKTMCKGRLYAEREVMACVAGILALWDAEPVDDGWKLPKKMKATGVYYPKTAIRVRLTTRTSGL